MKFAGLFCGFTLAVLAFSEKRVDMEALPPAVQTAVKEQTNGAEILNFAKEQEKGRTLYEAETRRNGKSRDLTFAANGKLLEIEEEIDLGAVPASVQAALQKQAAGASIVKVESVTRGTAITYEATLKTKTGKKKEITVPSGNAFNR